MEFRLPEPEADADVDEAVVVVVAMEDVRRATAAASAMSAQARSLPKNSLNSCATAPACSRKPSELTVSSHCRLWLAAAAAAAAVAVAVLEEGIEAFIAGCGWMTAEVDRLRRCSCRSCIRISSAWAAERRSSEMLMLALRWSGLVRVAGSVDVDDLGMEADGPCPDGDGSPKAKDDRKGWVEGEVEVDAEADALCAR